MSLDEINALPPRERAAALYRHFVPSGPWELETRRANYEKFFDAIPVPDTATFEQITIAGVPTIRVVNTSDPTDRAGVLLHGGGYVIGSAHGFRGYAAHLSAATRSVVYVVDYRRAPENPYPAQIEDATKVLEWAVGEHGSHHVFVTGDSAGGGLTVSTLLGLAERGAPRPGCGIVVSSMLNPAVDGKSFDTRAAADPSTGRFGILKAFGYYLGGRGPDEAPLAFSLQHGLSGLPPMFVLVGTEEVLYDDSVALAHKLEADGVKHTFREYSGMVHVWPIFAAFLPEAQGTIADMAAFVDAELAPVGALA